MTTKIKVVHLLLTLPLLCAAAAAQVRLSAEESEKLLVEKIEPPYPAIARAARAQGVVRVEATVGGDGTVLAARAISGHPLLQASAVSTVKKYRYKPHTVGGKPVAFITNAFVTYSLDGKPAPSRSEAVYVQQDEIARQYFETSERCRAALKKEDWKAAEKPCQAGVPLAEKLADGRELEKMGAYEMYGHVLLRTERPREALDYYQRAREVVAVRLDDKNAEMARLYGNIAIAHHALRELDKAREFYRRSERSFQLSIEHIGRDDPDGDMTKLFQQRYTASLKKIIGFHITAAEQSGAAAEVEELKRLLETLP